MSNPPSDIRPVVLYEDNHLLVVDKPAGLLTQSDLSGAVNLLDICRDYLRIRYGKPGNVFIGMVHRLDRPVSGVIVFARTSKGASRLSEQFRNGTIDKRYLAVVEGKPEENGELFHHLARRGSITVTTGSDEPGSRDSALRYRTVETAHDTSLLEITLLTGRKHQIRAQLSAIGHPVFGDAKYGSHHSLGHDRIALMCRSITLKHPTRDDILTFTAEPPGWWPWPFDEKTPLSR
jgi:23S rRNA pseudouridine1911/1915/1917 synthase